MSKIFKCNYTYLTVLSKLCATFNKKIILYLCFFKFIFFPNKYSIKLQQTIVLRVVITDLYLPERVTISH